MLNMNDTLRAVGPLFFAASVNATAGREEVTMSSTLKVEYANRDTSNSDVGLTASLDTGKAPE
jgi:hypothetical protein